MDIKELKAKFLAAKTASEEKPDDADLKSALSAAKSAYSDALVAQDDDDSKKDDSSSGKKGDDEDEEDSLDESKLDPKTKAHLAKLRRENAKHRTTAKNLGTRLSAIETGLKKVVGGADDERSAEDKLKDLEQNNEGMAFKTAVLEAALDNGVAKEDRKYFEFLVAERLAELKDGEELDETDFAAIAKSAKRTGGKIRTSVDDDKDGGKNPEGKTELDVDGFVKLDTVQKSELFVKNRALYDKLFEEAKNKRRL